MHSGYEGLYQAVRGSRQLRSACPRLFRDVLAVLSGLRPAFMLDYAALQPQQLADVAASVASALQLATAGLCVVELNECAFLVRPQLLPCPLGASAGGQQHQYNARRGQQEQQCTTDPAVLLLAFDGSRGVRWAAGTEAAEAAEQLDALRRGLLEQAGSVSDVGIPVVYASSIPSWQQLAPPTACGFLLGYPALYLCHSLEGAQLASRCLSSSTLCLHTVACQLAVPPGMPALEAEQPLLAFSVPAELAAAQAWKACWTAWQAQLQQQHDQAVQLGMPWSKLQLTVVSQRPRPVAL